MKLNSQRREPRLKAMEALGETREPLHFQVETLKFIQPGDKELLEECVRIADWILQYDGQSALHLVFGDQGLSPDILEKRRALIRKDRLFYEEKMKQNNHFWSDQTVIHLLNAAGRLFPFSDQLKPPLVKPTNQQWEKMCTWVRGHAPESNPMVLYNMLLGVDVERFHSLDLSVVRVASQEAIGRFRNPHGKNVSKELLKQLAQTRIVFPELIGPASLNQKERQALYADFEKYHQQRSRWDSERFLTDFYYLSVVEAPQLTVDATGIHLFPQTGSLAKAPELPIRPEVI